jgi:hypothetical protein
VGLKFDCPPVSSHYIIYANPLPASHTEGDGMYMAHSRGKIMKMSLHKDLCEPNSTSAFKYLMIHVFIFFLNYVTLKKKCPVQSYIYIYIYIFTTLKKFSKITTHNTFCKPPVSIFRNIKT